MPREEPCGNCGAHIWGPMCPIHPFYDPIEDQYWVGPICPYCGVTLMGVVHNEQELREDAKGGDDGSRSTHGGEGTSPAEEDSQTRYLPDTRRDMYGG